MKVSIPNPCHEDFHKMTPQEKGRYCSSCATCVIDFRDQSSREIILYLKENPKTCGVFLPKQLEGLETNTPIKVPQKWWAFLFAGSLGLSMQAQNQAEKEEVIFTETEMIAHPDCEETETIKRENILLGKVKSMPPTESVKPPADSVQYVTGTVIDNDGFPMADAEVIVVGTEKTTLTDLDGNFKIEANIGDQIEFIEGISGVSKLINVTQQNLGVIQLRYEIEIGVIIIKRKFPHNVIYTLGYPIRKIKDWIRR